MINEYILIKTNVKSVVLIADKWHTEKKTDK